MVTLRESVKSLNGEFDLCNTSKIVTVNQKQD